MSVSLNRTDYHQLIGILCAVNPDLIHLEELQPHLFRADLNYEHCYLPPVLGWGRSHIPDSSIRGVAEPPVTSHAMDE